MLAVAAVVVILDQATKAAVRSSLAPGESVTLVPGIMDLRLVFNTGAAFSLGEGAGLLFVGFAAVVVVAVSVLVWREPTLPVPLVATLGCVVGGGIGNAIDRVAFGRVTDFLATTFIDFPVFNVADIFVTTCVVVSAILYVMWGEGEEPRPQDASGEESRG